MNDHIGRTWARFDGAAAVKLDAANRRSGQRRHEAERDSEWARLVMDPESGLLDPDQPVPDEWRALVPPSRCADDRQLARPFRGRAQRTIRKGPMSDISDLATRLRGFDYTTDMPDRYTMLEAADALEAQQSRIAALEARHAHLKKKVHDIGTAQDAWDGNVAFDILCRTLDLDPDDLSDEQDEKVALTARIALAKELAKRSRTMQRIRWRRAR